MMIVPEEQYGNKKNRPVPTYMCMYVQCDGENEQREEMMAENLKPAKTCFVDINIH